VSTNGYKPSNGTTDSNGLDNTDHHEHGSTSILDLFRIPLVRRYTLVMFYLWFVFYFCLFRIEKSVNETERSVYYLQTKQMY